MDKILGWLVFVAFTASLIAGVGPTAIKESQRAEDGLPIGVTWRMVCPYCGGEANYQNPRDGTEGDFHCKKCGSYSSLRDHSL